ncbi:hypothetical protein AYL99_05070 [Fonsecaea erecta]|uniref:Xylanolytic transcriptional activator regulatory domain-containing protein n=1 Tax=Fonsecaea erecta TaxID=1367422 RepID=A0A178ZJU0_9EURO|nr:hypothetical protein AYL99_05070 [Fonsecaea erecta]OAP60068.1 hypothetical protein AYL99_05070 [Fonsecaea erecta]
MTLEKLASINPRLSSAISAFTVDDAVHPSPSEKANADSGSMYFVELGVQCVYERLPRKQILSSKKQASYSRRLRALEDVLQDLVQNQHPVHMDLGKPDLIPDESSHMHLDGLQEPRSSDPEKVYRTTNYLEENGDEDTVDGMATVTSPKTMSSMVFGPSSNIAFLRQVIDATSAASQGLGKTSLSGNTASRTYISSDASPDNPRARFSSTARQPFDPILLPSDSHARHLIRLFFSNIGMLFPVVHESVCIRVYCTAKLDGPGAVSQSWLCLLNVIFALATCASTTPNQSAERDEETAEEFIERAEALAVHIAMKSADLEIVQCLLLIAQYCQGTQRPDEAWHLHGLAVRAAIQLGLHSSHAYTELKPLECELRKRTWFGCVILDRMLSMTLGRPCTISDELLQLDLPSDIGLDAVSRGSTRTTSDEQPAAPYTVCLFIATIQLYDVLADIIKKLYGSNVDADAQQTVPALLATISQLEHKLEVWKQNLPPQLQQVPSEIKLTGWNLSSSPGFAPVFDRLSVILALRYLNTRILLHRPILSACLRQRYPFGTLNEPASDVHDKFPHEFASISVEICERSAVEVIDIVCKASRHPRMLGTWWFSAYYTYNAALVIFCCILLHATTTPGRSKSTETAEHQRANLGKIVHLQRAIEATGRLGPGSITARKIQQALLTHRQTCMALVQSDMGDSGKAFASESSTTAAGGTLPPPPPKVDAVQVSNAIGMGSSEASSVPFLDLGQDDPFVTLDEGIDQSWSDIDWFSDVFGPDTQLGSYPRPSSAIEDLLPNGRFVGMSLD